MADKTVASLSSSTPTIDDLTISYDNADTSELKKTTWQNVRDLFKTYFDTIYASLSGGTFTGDISVPDEAYGTGWNGSLEVPTKNAVYDKIETISGGGSSTLAGLTDVTIATPTNGQALIYETASSKWKNQSLAGGGDALTTNPLSQFASTTSLQLKGVISDETGSGALVFGTSPTLTTPVLGTPSSGTLTNCTGLPIAGLVASTATAIGVGTIELGHASDTTISRSSAGVIAIEGVVVPTVSSTSTLTNKRVQKRVVVTTQSATPAINTDNGDIFQITGLAQAITSMSTNLSGTPVAGEMMMIQITDNGTARTITWGASFASTTNATLPTTTVISTMLRVVFQRNNANTIWDCVAVV